MNTKAYFIIVLSIITFLSCKNKCTKPSSPIESTTLYENKYLEGFIYVPNLDKTNGIIRIIEPIDNNVKVEKLESINHSALGVLYAKADCLPNALSLKARQRVYFQIKLIDNKYYIADSIRTDSPSLNNLVSRDLFLEEQNISLMQLHYKFVNHPLRQIHKTGHIKWIDEDVFVNIENKKYIKASFHENIGTTTSQYGTKIALPNIYKGIDPVNDTIYLTLANDSIMLSDNKFYKKIEDISYEHHHDTDIDG